VPLAKSPAAPGAKPAGGQKPGGGEDDDFQIERF
jgi:hypothetical protein